TSLPLSRPRSSAASRVIDEVIVSPPSSATFTTAIASPAVISVTVPASWLRVESLMTWSIGPALRHDEVALVAGRTAPVDGRAQQRLGLGRPEAGAGVPEALDEHQPSVPSEEPHPRRQRRGLVGQRPEHVAAQHDVVRRALERRVTRVAHREGELGTAGRLLP